MRKPFLDNLRYGIVLSVAVYHVFYQFNSVGVITNVLIPGIPALDAPLYVLYPWFMAALFMISGICARYSLEKQTGSQYLKGKVRRQLVPSIAIIFLIGWSTGWVTDQYANIFGGNGGQVPGFAKYLVWCMSGIGVLWFLHELLLCEVVLVLIRKLDKKDRLWQLGGKANFPVICLLVLGLWGSAYVLNTPVIEVYRNGFYLFCFLAGYILFSHEQIQSLLAKWAPCMLAVSGVLAVVYTVHFWGQNYAALNNLKAPLTNLYAWFACLGVLGAGKRWLDKETAFTRCMASRSFGIYVLHNPLLVLLAWAMDKLAPFPRVEHVSASAGAAGAAPAAVDRAYQAHSRPAHIGAGRKIKNPRHGSCKPWRGAFWDYSMQIRLFSGSFFCPAFGTSSVRIPFSNLADTSSGFTSPT